MVRALLIESKAEIRGWLTEYAQPLGIDLYAAASLTDGRGLIAALKPALAIVDRELADGDGLDLIGEASAMGALAIVVSQRNETSDRISALKLGADEYFGKPADPEEFYLRLRNLLARRPATVEKKSVVFEFAGIKIDLTTRAILDPLGRPGPELTDSELSVLRALADNVDLVVDRAALYAVMTGIDVVGVGPLDKASRAVDTCVSRLRIKLKHAQGGVEIRSLRQVGYVLRRERGRETARRA